MAYQQSPGVQVIEKDASSVTVGLSSTVGATVGAHNWGPVMSPVLISNEDQLVSMFGTPSDKTASYFFAAANFLKYANSCWVNRVIKSTAINASASGTGILIKNADEYATVVSGDTKTSGEYAARYPGNLGTGIKVSIADSATFVKWEYKSFFSVAPGTSEYAEARGASNDELHLVVIDMYGKFTGTPGSVLERYEFLSKASDALSYQQSANYYAKVLENNSSYVYFLNHPQTVSNWGDATVGSSGIPTTYDSLSLAVTATGAGATWLDGTATLSYPTTTVAKFSVGEIIEVAGFTPSAYNGSFAVTACTATSVSYAIVADPGTVTAFGTVTGTYEFTYPLTGGTDGATVDDGDLELGWDIFNDSQTYDISLLITGNASIALSRYVTQNIADVRKDCLAFSSVTTTATGVASPIPLSSTDKALLAKAFKTFDSTYAVIDSGYKYMYDKYNKVNRWIALNADVAGLCARVDVESDPWYSPAGLVKGQVKDVIKLSWNPNKSERDVIYPAAINPVISQVGQGTMLFGDSTATTKPSAFNKINVRRLFLILERSISNSAKYQLFELNDEITRLQFVSSIEPFLRDVRGRRGIDDFRIICDETNNTPQVISSNSFVGTILVRPKYSINFITLNFTAVGPSVTFEQAALV